MFLQINAALQGLKGYCASFAGLSLKTFVLLKF